MSTASGPLTTGHHDGAIVPIALAALVTVFKGAAAAVVAGTGYGTPLVPTNTAHLFEGVWGETITSASSAGVTFTQIVRKGIWQFSQSGITASNIGQRCYFSDDNTVTLAAGTTFAGIICAVDAAGQVWVDIESAVRDESATNAGTALVLTAPVTTTNVSGAAQVLATQTLAANAVKVGDRIRLRGQLIGVTRTSTDTIALALYFGTTSIFTLAAAFAHATTNFLYFDVELVVQSIGSGGTVMGAGLVNGGTAGATTTGLNLASTTLNTAIAEAFTIQGTFSASNTTDQIAVNIFDLDLIRA